MKKCCRLMDISCNYNSITWADGHLSIHKACRPVCDSCPQEMSRGWYCRDQFQTPPSVHKPTATGIFLKPLTEKK